MNTGFMIITNNPLVKEKLGEDYHVEYEELSYEDTLKKVQKMIFQGYRLLTHPLSGSVKPNGYALRNAGRSGCTGDADHCKRHSGVR